MIDSNKFGAAKVLYPVGILNVIIMHTHINDNSYDVFYSTVVISVITPYFIHHPLIQKLGSMYLYGYVDLGQYAK